MFSGSQVSKLGVQHPPSHDTSSRSEHIGLSDLNAEKIRRGDSRRNLRRAYFTSPIVRDAGVRYLYELVHKEEDQFAESCTEPQSPRRDNRGVGIHIM